MVELPVPRARLAVLDQQYTGDAERKSATIAYYVSTDPTVSWENLASALYEHEQDRAVIAVKLHLPNEKGKCAHGIEVRVIELHILSTNSSRQCARL